jgi:hypothetical protein
MSKRKPAKASQRASNSKKMSRPQRAGQAVRKSPRPSRPPPVAAEHPSGSQRQGPFGALKQAAPTVENPATAFQDDGKLASTDNSSTKGSYFPLATANGAWAYQAKLQEAAQAEINFAFESAQRLATIRSPVEFPRIIAEFMSKRIAMYMEMFRRA